MVEKKYTTILALFGVAFVLLVTLIVLIWFQFIGSVVIVTSQKVNSGEVSIDLGLKKARELGIKNDELGEQLFKINCKSCHNISSDLIGPALASVKERHSEDWIIEWVKGPRTMVESGDPEAVELYNKWSDMGYMTAFNLSPEKIRSILNYIDFRAVVEGEH